MTLIHHEAPAPVALFDQEKIELVKRTIMPPDSSNDELELFIAVCVRTGLDPFTNQIYAIKRYDSARKANVVKHQTGIDGYRLIADRTGKYDGQDEAEWCGEDGVYCALAVVCAVLPLVWVWGCVKGGAGV